MPLNNNGKIDKKKVKGVSIKMSYFDGNEFFLFLAIALIIGFIINYLGKKNRILYINIISNICRSNIW